MRRTLLAIVGAIVLAGSTAFAHHSYTNFLIDRTVLIEGEMQELLYTNPHVVLTIRTAAGTYSAVWESPNNIARHGHFTASTLKIGDRIVVVGSPARDAEARTLARLREVLRPSDGWRWQWPRVTE